MWKIRIEIFGRQMWENGDIVFSVYSGLLNSSYSKAFAVFFFLSRDHWLDSNARADNTPHPCHGSITTRNDVEIGLYTFVPQVCRCLVAVPMCCGYTYSR